MRQEQSFCPLLACINGGFPIECSPHACMWAVEYCGETACALAVMAAEQDPQRIGVKTIGCEEDSDA
jgi:hypothetical protein